MLQRGIQIRTVEDLVQMRLDASGSASHSKVTSSGAGAGAGGGMHSGTSMEISSMTRCNFIMSIFCRICQKVGYIFSVVHLTNQVEMAPHVPKRRKNHQPNKFQPN